MATLRNLAVGVLTMTGRQHRRGLPEPGMHA